MINKAQSLQLANCVINVERRKGMVTASSKSVYNLTLVSLLMFLSCQSPENSETPNLRVEATTTWGNASLPKYSIISEDILDTPGKTQIELILLIEEDSASKENLSLLMNSLYSMKARKTGFKYHKNPTNIYIYAYTSKEKANSGMGQWIAMCSKGPLDQKPSISISEVQLRAQTAPVEEKFGLTQEMRETIWTEIVKAEDRALKEADQKYTMIATNNDYGPENIEKNIEYSRAATERYHLNLARKYSITPEIIDSISFEGIIKGWAFPEY